MTGLLTLFKSWIGAIHTHQRKLQEGVSRLDELDAGSDLRSLISKLFRKSDKK